MASTEDKTGQEKDDKQLTDGFSVNGLQKLLIGQTSDKLFIIKFGAPWCGPCQKIKPMANAKMSKLTTTYNEQVVCVDICIDDDLDLYAELKRRRVVKGVPSILAYRGADIQEPWYQPMDSVSGGDEAKLLAFFERCEGYMQ